jgi:hypothetical protein
MNYWNEPIQFYARTQMHIEQLALMYLGMDSSMRGEFYVPKPLLDHARACGIQNAVPLQGSVNEPLEAMPPSSTAPMVTTGYRDLLLSVRTNNRRPQIYVQHDTLKAAAQNMVKLFVCPTPEREAWVKQNWNKAETLLMNGPASATSEAISAFAKKVGNLRVVDQIEDESIGIIYMSFGEKAARAVKASAASLRRVGLQIPVCVIGSTPVDGFPFIEWAGESPFDGSQRQNFQFRAGRVKPKLYELSPFQRTLYLDADTEFIGNIMPGFDALGECDVAIARENLTLQQLYNKKLAGWEINIQERDATMDELGAGPNVHFLNSGVLFFRKSFATEAGMRRWHEAWMEWQQWDEQLAFMRGFHRTPEARVKLLEPEWNYPHKHKGIVIFHNYGRGVVRMNAPLAVSDQQLAISETIV